MYAESCTLHLYYTRVGILWWEEGTGIAMKKLHIDVVFSSQSPVAKCNLGRLRRTKILKGHVPLVYFMVTIILSCTQEWLCRILCS